MTFHGESRVAENVFHHAYESPRVMTVPLAILAIGSIFSGMLLSDFFIGEKQEIFWHYAIVLTNENNFHMPFVQTLIIKSSVSLGVIIAALLYFYKTNEGVYFSSEQKTLIQFCD